MSWTASTEQNPSLSLPQSLELRPIQVVGADQKNELENQARLDEFLLAGFEPPGPSWRGRLGLLIEGAVEAALEARGAAPPGVGASSDLDGSLSDQIYRARLVGCGGIAISFPLLEGIANLAGALDAEDSAVMRWWFAATNERPVKLILNSADRYLGVYGAPLALEDLLTQADAGVNDADAAPMTAPEQAAAVAAMELSEPAPEVTSPSVARAYTGADGNAAAGDLEAAGDLAVADDDNAQGELFAALDGEAVDADAVEDAETEHQAGADAAEPLSEPSVADGAPSSEGLASSAVAAAVASDRTDDEVDTSADEQATDAEDLRRSGHEPTKTTETVVAHDEALADEPPDAPAAGSAVEGEWLEAPELDAARFDAAMESLRSFAPSLETEPPPARSNERVDLDEVMSAVAEEEPMEKIVVRPLHARARRDWQSWVRALEAARGPKPLAVVERLFASAYVPLADAVACGIADESATAVLESWATSFEKSYSEAFDALRLRGKRPTMVLDVPEIAARIGRLHGARSVQLLMVDGMRFDLGLRVHEKLRGLLGQQAACTERLLLWSALPTNTETQLDLIGHGPDGLKEMVEAPECEVPVARGRAATTARIVKTHHREVHKLDLVEAKLSMPGGPAVARLETLSSEVATSIAAHLRALPPQTLVMVFGDHGFVFDALEDGTAAARHGGASPEEVLVPAFGWLVGDVH